MKFKFNNLYFNEDKGVLESISYNEHEYNLNGILWNIEYFDENNNVQNITPENEFVFSHTIVGNTLQMKWKNQQLYVLVEIKNIESKTYWKITSNFFDNVCHINKVTFPIIKGFSSLKETDSEDYLLIPYQNGWLIKNPIDNLLNNDGSFPFWLGRGGKCYESDYPASLNYQFSAYYIKNGLGCYMATEDSEAYIKSYGYYLENDNDFSYRIINYPENMGKTSSYCMPYDFVLDFYNGDWQNPTHMYREWAIKQKWCKLPLKEKQLSNNLLSRDLWRINHSTFNLGKRTQEYFDTCKIIRDKVNCNLGLHWYGWNMGEHDVNYPEYISREKYAEGWDKELTEWNKKFDQENILKIPYINARLWDRTCPAWAEDNAEKSALKNQNGDMYLEPWKFEDHLKPMCPTTALWQNKVNDFCSNYILNNGFDGMYIDQVGSYNATLCFDENHPHPLGGGTWWSDSYHNMLNKLRDKVGKDKILTTESCCETYLDLFDMFLILDTHIYDIFGFNCAMKEKEAEAIPLFSIIYGDYAIAYGSVCRFSDPINAFEYNFIRNIVWGFLPTIEGIEQFQIDNDDYFEIVKKGVDFYKQNKDLLLYGRIISIPDSSPNTIDLVWKTDDKESKRTYPAVISAKWESADGDIKYIFYNTLDSDVDIVFDNNTATVYKKSFLLI